MADTPSVVINRDKAREAAFDYEQLRREAIAHVQALSGNTWTDYNLHDPGVTILEQLCMPLPIWPTVRIFLLMKYWPIRTVTLIRCCIPFLQKPLSSAQRR